MPPKIFFQLAGDRFYSAMASCCPPLGFAGCKWQSGDPANPARSLPYVQGLYVLNEHPTGSMVAVMDSKWITGRRTAAASALVARHQARAGSEELAILGCGVQGRAHLRALAAELPGLRRCIAYDIVPERQAAFVEEYDGRYDGLRVRGAADAEEALRDADVIITGGPIQVERRATIPSHWIRPGALVVAIDFDSYVTDECIAAMDIVLTDDREQLEGARRGRGQVPRCPAPRCRGRRARRARQRAPSERQPTHSGVQSGYRAGGRRYGRGALSPCPRPRCRGTARSVRPRLGSPFEVDRGSWHNACEQGSACDRSEAWLAALWSL